MTDCVCECSRSSNDPSSSVFWGMWGPVAFLSDLSTICGSGSPHQLYTKEKHTHVGSVALSLALKCLASLTPVEFNNKGNTTSVKWFYILQG